MTFVIFMRQNTTLISPYRNDKCHFCEARQAVESDQLFGKIEQLMQDQYLTSTCQKIEAPGVPYGMDTTSFRVIRMKNLKAEILRRDQEI
jgi:hypothetical protein